MTTRTRPRAGGGGRVLQRAQVRDVLSMLYPEQQIGLWMLGDGGLAQVKDHSRQQNHGVYSASGVTLNEPGLNNSACAKFDGSAGYANVYSAGLNADFNNQALTAAILMKMAASGVWTDATTRYGVRFAVDTNNWISLSRTTADNTLEAQYRAGATAKVVAVAGNSDLDWFLLVMTVSKAADELKFWKRSPLAGARGMQIGSTMTGLGTWAGALSSTLCCLGAQSTTPAGVHSGWLLGGALWTVAIPEVDLQAAGDALFG